MVKTKKAGEAQGVKPAKKVKKAKAAELSNVIETTVKKEQRYLYKFQVKGEKLTPGKAKQMRQKIRRQLDQFDAAIRMEKNAEKRKKAIEEFKAFYKDNFILNDLSLKSITDSTQDYKVESYTEMLKAVKGEISKTK